MTTPVFEGGEVEQVGACKFHVSCWWIRLLCHKKVIVQVAFPNKGDYVDRPTTH